MCSSDLVALSTPDFDVGNTVVYPDERHVEMSGQGPGDAGPHLEAGAKTRPLRVGNSSEVVKAEVVAFKQGIEQGACSIAVMIGGHPRMDPAFGWTHSIDGGRKGVPVGGHRPE